MNANEILEHVQYVRNHLQRVMDYIDATGCLPNDTVRWAEDVNILNSVISNLRGDPA